MDDALTPTALTLTALTLTALTLTAVGCSGSLSGPDSPASAYLVQTPVDDGSFSLLLDCGPGAVGALYRYLDPARLDAVALSHLHPDHCLDLTGLFVASRYSPTAPWPAIELYGPPGTLVRLARAYDPTPSRPDDGDVADFAEAFTERIWQPDQQIGPLSVRTATVAHPVPCFATRLEAGGRTLVYSGDTGPTEALVDLARGADLLLCEAAFVSSGPGAPANPVDVHLTGADAGEIARRAGVARLVLTHIPPWQDPERVLAEAAGRFDGPIELATTGARFSI